MQVPEGFEPKVCFTDSQILDDYIHAGNAVLRLQAPSGKAHTYVYKIPRDIGGYDVKRRFVYARHENEKTGLIQEFYLGQLSPNTDLFELTRASRFLPGTEIVNGAIYIDKMRRNQDLFSASPMKLYHLGFCGRCGRPLEDEESLKYGLGKKCRKRIDEFVEADVIPTDDYVARENAALTKPF